MQIINIMASSLDGYIGAFEGEGDRERLASGFLIPEDNAQVEGYLAEADAVIVGGSTMRASEGIWIPKKDAAKKTDQPPLWIVISNQGIPDSHPFWSHPSPKDGGCARLIASSNLALEARCQNLGVDFLALEAKSNPASQIVQKLEELKKKRVILFGGGKINACFYKLDLIDELILTLCPLIIAHSGAPRLVEPALAAPKTFQLASFEIIKNHVILKYRSQKNLQN